MPKILAIIVTWNKKQYVLDLLTSLDNIDWPREQLDIVIVDNASEDGTVEALKNEFPNIQLLCNEENLGGTGGFNTGLQWAFQQHGYDYLWLLDNDVVVHRSALKSLANTLDSRPDVAVAGSAMMQLDYPWRVNEIGAFFDQQTGRLNLNQHLLEIPEWKNQSVQPLLETEADLSKLLPDCPLHTEVDYVAAASLLIRAGVAKEAGLWRDYFIHFDDVDWCLRIRAMGHRVVACSQSLVWHLSAIAKIPTWVLYYDNRNVLDVLKTHGAGQAVLKRLQRYILKKAVYYHLIGKADLARLHHEALKDFRENRLGKKDIQLDTQYRAFTELVNLSAGKNVLISWTTEQKVLGKVRNSMPGAHVTEQYKSAKSEWFWRFKRYDYVVQSDYKPSIMLAWLGTDCIYANHDGFCVRAQPRIWDIVKSVLLYAKGWL
ncbi:MAG: glycosyltransferase family 2 protein [Pseudomonadota bacterium]